MDLENRRFLLLFIDNRTEDQKRRLLEKAFFHDFSNLLGGLSTASYLLSRGDHSEKVINTIHTVTNQMIREVEIQRSLMNNDLDFYKALWSNISIKSIFGKLEELFRERTAKKGMELLFRHSPHIEDIRSDEALLIRVISNMIVNAMEATAENSPILVSAEATGDLTQISVHNREFIPYEVQRRIFQRNFSTKSGQGRGIGTYSMKLFGESILGGQVGFTSTPEWGTEFHITIPS